MRNYVNDNDFYQIYGFMRRAGLSGYTLQIYAIIYSYTTASAACTGSIKYFSDWTGASKPTVKDSLKKLIKAGLITKVNYTDGNLPRCLYKAIKPPQNEQAASGQTSGQKAQPPPIPPPIAPGKAANNQKTTPPRKLESYERQYTPEDMERLFPYDELHDVDNINF